MRERLYSRQLRIHIGRQRTFWAWHYRDGWSAGSELLTKACPQHQIRSHASTAPFDNAFRGWCAAILLFSENLANHIGAIKYFICNCNLTKSAALPR